MQGGAEHAGNSCPPAPLGHGAAVHAGSCLTPRLAALPQCIVGILPLPSCSRLAPKRALPHVSSRSSRTPGFSPAGPATTPPLPPRRPPAPTLAAAGGTTAGGSRDENQVWKLASLRPQSGHRARSQMYARAPQAARERSCPH
ncbi:unnamed protein product [Lepidochelys kempii]